MKLHSNKLTIGADPEFLIIHPTTHQRENPFFHYGDSSVGSIGVDGLSAELRPAWGYPSDVVASMRFLFARSMEPNGISRNSYGTRGNYYSMLMASGGGERWEASVGGHIHLGVKFDDSNNEELTRMGSILDKFVGRPLQLMEGGRRYGTGYGFPSDFHTDKSFGVEYRTAPSWVSDPGFAESVLSIAFLLVEKVLVNPDFLRAHSVPGSKRADNGNWIWPEQLATDDDYMSLIPQGIYHDHWHKQVTAFIDYLRGGFDLSTLEMRERWLEPVVLPWRPGQLGYDILGKFHERIAREEQERLERLECERIAREERERRARENQARLERERALREEEARLARLRNADPRAIEQAIWGSVVEQPVMVRARSTNIRVSAHRTVVVVHTNTVPNARGEIDHNLDQMSIEVRGGLRVGSLRVVMQHDYRSWFHRLGRSGRSRWGRRHRSVSWEEGVLYMSKDLQPLVKRRRGAPFRIKFMDFAGTDGSAARTVFFIKSEALNLAAVYELLGRHSKTRVPSNFYWFEELNTRARTAALERIDQAQRDRVAAERERAEEERRQEQARIEAEAREVAATRAALEPASVAQHEGAPRFYLGHIRGDGYVIVDRALNMGALFGTLDSMNRRWGSLMQHPTQQFINELRWSNIIDITQIDPVALAVR